LRGVFGQACVSNCADAAIVVLPEDEVVRQSLRGLRILLDIATSGMALYNPCVKTKAQLVEMLQCAGANNSGGVHTIKVLVTLFSRYTCMMHLELQKVNSSCVRVLHLSKDKTTSEGLLIGAPRCHIPSHGCMRLPAIIMSRSLYALPRRQHQHQPPPPPQSYPAHTGP
jgi:hypothetical protein